MVGVEESPSWLVRSQGGICFKFLRLAGGGVVGVVAVVVVEESPRWLGLSPRWFMV